MTDTQTTPARTRSTWTHGDVAALVRKFQDDPDRDGFDERERAKLIDLGLVAKAEKPALSAADRASLDKMAAAVAIPPEPTRTLAIRYAIEKLREHLPKRERK